MIVEDVNVLLAQVNNMRTQAILLEGSRRADYTKLLLDITNIVLESQYSRLEEGVVAQRVYIVQPKAASGSDSPYQRQAITREALMEGVTYALSSTGGIYLRRVLIINDIDRAYARALQVLLKFLEDLPGDIYVIMTTRIAQRILPTIYSRVLTYRIPDEIISSGEIVIPQEWHPYRQLLLTVCHSQEQVARITGQITPEEVRRLIEAYARVPKRLEFFHLLLKHLVPANHLFITTLLQQLLTAATHEQLRSVCVLRKPQRERILNISVDITKAIAALNQFIQDTGMPQSDYEVHKYAFIARLLQHYG